MPATSNNPETIGKIVHLITRLDPGGSAEEALESCAGLAERGWDVVLASGPGMGGSGAVPDSGGARVEMIPSLTRDPDPFRDPLALWQIVKLLRRERPDIVHTHSAKAGVLGRWAGWLMRVPVIAHTPHGHVLYGYARGFKNWLYLTAERITAPITDCLVAVSDGERRESIEAGIGKEHQWVVAHSGIHFDELPYGGNSAGPDGPVRVGVVARLEPVKGVDLIVSAAGRLAETDFDRPYEILIWGGGALEEELRAQAGDVGAADTVLFVGTDQPVNEFIRSLHVYSQPSRNEGMGRALVVAQAMGIPIVATRVCGIPDVVRDGESGILTNPEDPEDLARALATMIRDPDRREAMGQRAADWMRELDDSGYPEFSFESMLWHLEQTYRRLLGREAQ